MEPLTANQVAVFIPFAFMAGSIMVLIFEAMWPKLFSDNVWIEVDPRYEINALEALKHVPGMRAFLIPCSLELKEDRSIAFNPTYVKFTIHLPKLKGYVESLRRGEQVPATRYLHHFLGVLEDHGVPVLSSGVY